jgi:hypothetical protein
MDHEQDWRAHEERHKALCARWGKPEPVDIATALTALDSADCPATAVPYDRAFAFRYTSREAAEAFATSNLDAYGHQSLGIAVTDGGVIGVLLLAEETAARTG